jgi:hypothetical protein
MAQGSTPPEGDSPSGEGGRALLADELRAEGREVQSVGDRRTPTVSGQ